MPTGSAPVRGELLATPDQRFALVASRFNQIVVEPLVAGAMDTLTRHGVKPECLSRYEVPGAWELPVVVAHLARSGAWQGIVVLGAVIRGETPHFEYVAGESARVLADLAAETGVPIGFGLLTVDTTEQAIARAGGKAGNKGAEAALACLETASLLRRLATLGPSA